MRRKEAVIKHVSTSAGADHLSHSYMMGCIFLGCRVHKHISALKGGRICLGQSDDLRCHVYNRAGWRPIHSEATGNSSYAFPEIYLASRRNAFPISSFQIDDQ